MFKSFVLGLYASGHSLHVRVTQTFAVNRFRTGAIYSMHSKTTHRLSFLKDGAKVLLFLGTDWILCAYYAVFFCVFFNFPSFFLAELRLISHQK